MFKTCFLAMAGVGLIVAANPRAIQSQPPKIEAHVDPKVSIKEDDTKNGWEVRLKYQSSEKFARSGHTWTFDEAQDLVEDLKKQNAALDKKLQAAEILIVGKEGDGKVKDDEGPTLPDWPELQNRFLGLTPEATEDLSAALKELEEAYEEAQKAIEKVLRPRGDLTAEELTIINDLVEKYNERLGKVQRKLFRDQPIPLPRLQRATPSLPQQRQDWVQAREAQREVEELGSHVRSQMNDLELEEKRIKSETKRLVIDDTIPRDVAAQQKAALEKDREKFEEKKQVLRKNKDILEELRSQNNAQLNAARNQLVNTDEVVPPATRFTGPGGKATYSSRPGVKVIKTDPAGKPLPDDKQPQGYPRVYQPGQKLAADEAKVVDPVLRVKPSEPGASVQAGVYGKVLKVDPANQSVEVQVDPFGNKLVFNGVVPGGIKEGDYIGPRQSLGKANEVRIRAVNPKQRYINPMPLLNTATTPPASYGSLARPGQASEAQLLPTKEKAIPETLDGSGKPTGGVSITFNDNEPKRKPGELTRNQLDFKEAVAKRSMERLVIQEKDAVDQLSMANQKRKQTESELSEAKSTLDNISLKARDLVQQAKEFKQLLGEIEKEQAALDAEKESLDDEAAKLRGSKNREAVEAYNRKARAFNMKLEALEKKKSKARDIDPTNRLIGLKREKERAEKDKAVLESRLPGLELAAARAQAKADKAKADAIKKEMEIKALASQKDKVKPEDD